MKRLSLLTKLAMVGVSAAAVTPIALVATSCTPTRILVDCFNYDAVADLEDTDAPLNPPQAKMSFDKLLFGTRSIHNGNYVLFCGSNTYSSVCHFFTSSEEGERERWFGEDFFNSYLFHGVKEAQGQGEMIEEGIGFYNVIDYFNFKFYDKKNHQIILYDKNERKIRDKIGPYDTWTKSLISGTYTFNNSSDNPLGKYEWDDESVKEGDYIREDASAKAFRAFSQRGADLFPKKEGEGEGRDVTFDTDGTNKGQIAVFKDGKLQTIESLPTDGSAFSDLLLKYFKSDDPEPEPELI